MKKSLLLVVFALVGSIVFAQTLGGGTMFSNAVTFDNSWLVGCPGGGSAFSNQVAFEPTTAMDPCAPAPACATGTTGSDVWFRFYAESPTAIIVVAPSSSFDVSIQAFSGSTCATLTTIGCVDLAGNNGSETLNLSGLVADQAYYFRIFGATTSLANRTGTYSFCGSQGLKSGPFAVTLTAFSANVIDGSVQLDWTTASESNNSFFQIERSIDGVSYDSIAVLRGSGTATANTDYKFVDHLASFGANYYRLRQVDFDGQQTVFGSIEAVVDSKHASELVVFPNPTVGQVEVSVTANHPSITQVTVVDALGKIVARQSQVLNLGGNTFSIENVADLPAGIYTLHLSSPEMVDYTKFIKR